MGSNRLFLAIAVSALVLSAASFAMSFALGRGPGFGSFQGPGNAPGYGMMGGGNGMMGGAWRGGPEAGSQGGSDPGSRGFVPGTTAAPRIVRIAAGPGPAFYPTNIRVVRGETITFVVTTMGPAIHEFMVGPADAVAVDADGTPEIADIGMMQTRSLTYTFDGPGPFAFACHEPGHYEAGMRGVVEVVREP